MRCPSANADTRQQQTGAVVGHVAGARRAHGALPEPVHQRGRRRLEALAAFAQDLAGKGAAQQVDARRRVGVARIQRPAKGSEFVRVAAAAEAQFQPAVAEGIDDRGILGQAQRFFQGQNHEGGAQPQPLRPLGGGG